MFPYERLDSKENLLNSAEQPEQHLFIMHNGRNYSMLDSEGNIVDRFGSEIVDYDVFYQSNNNKVYPNLRFRFLSENHQIAFFEDKNHTPFCCFEGGPLMEFQTDTRYQFKCTVKNMITSPNLDNFMCSLKKAKIPPQQNLPRIDKSNIRKIESVQSILKGKLLSLDEYYKNTAKTTFNFFDKNISKEDRRKLFWEGKKLQCLENDTYSLHACSLLALHPADYYFKKGAVIPLLGGIAGLSIGVLSSAWCGDWSIIAGVSSVLSASCAGVGAIAENCIADERVLTFGKCVYALNRNDPTNIPVFSDFIKRPVPMIRDFVDNPCEKASVTRFGNVTFPAAYDNAGKNIQREQCKFIITHQLCGKTVIPPERQATLIERIK